ncbi:MAG: short-chain fatty acyl-CoA regulator family protein, partial [Gemmobacter sp.]
MRAPVGNRIRRQRQELGITQTSLASMVGISSSYLNLIENSKRDVGGALLLRIADHLRMNLDDLSGERERKTLHALQDLLLDPLLQGLDTSQTDIRDLVARFPEIAQVLMRLHRAGVEALAEVEAFTSRFNDDPVLAQMLHQVLNRITGMRSGAEIIAGAEELSEADRRRFSTAIHHEAQELSDTMRALVGYFDRAAVRRRAISPVREVEDAVIAANNHFPALETLAGRLRAAIPGSFDEAGLRAHLLDRFGIKVERRPEQPGAPVSRQSDQARMDDAARPVLWLRASAPLATRLFRICRHIAELAAPEEIDSATDALGFSTGAARDLGRRALASYVAGAMLMPYAPFRAAAEDHGYDIDLLGHMFGASFEQAAHRLVTLRRPGAEGVPFGFLRTDPAGRLTKRFPLPGLGQPGGGHGCVLWPIYHAVGSPGVVRQVAEMPNGSRFLMIAKAVPKRVSTWAEQPLTFSVMLACDIHHAARTVYAGGLNLDDRATHVPVG